MPQSKHWLFPGRQARYPPVDCLLPFHQRRTRHPARKKLLVEQSDVHRCIHRSSNPVYRILAARLSSGPCTLLDGEAMNSVRVGQAIFLVGGTIALYLLLRRLVHSRSASSPPAQYGFGPERLPPCGPPTSPQQTKCVRLYQVYPPPESSTEIDVDIIAIYGLNTKSPDTWL